jgi:hypothetical protein
VIVLADVGDLAIGLALGLVAGILLGPVIRFWVAWKEWERASSEARLTEDAMRRMGRPPWRASVHRAVAPTRKAPAHPDAL